MTTPTPTPEGPMTEHDKALSRDAAFERRSCLLKRRFSYEPPLRMNQYAYKCQFCDGWHVARKTDRRETPWT
jgi:hypothetical protein